MSPSPLPQWHPSSLGQTTCRRIGFFRSFSSIHGIGIFGAFLLVVLIFDMTFFSSHGSQLLSSLNWYHLSTNSAEHVGSNTSLSTPINHAATSDSAHSSSPSDVLSLEQIRDIVAPTRGFFSRDYSLHLGWNNVSICGNPN
jgi:hypothetical protein